jgi:hypothetical protein
MQTAAASLVAAVPAGLLATLLVMVFLNYAEALTGPGYGIVGATLACCALIALTPFGVLIFGGKKKSAAGAAKSGSKAAGKQDEDNVATDANESAGDDGDVAAEVSDDIEMSDVDTDTVDFDSAELTDDIEEFADEQEDEPPAKATKKKKK